MSPANMRVSGRRRPNESAPSIPAGPGSACARDHLPSIRAAPDWMGAWANWSSDQVAGSLVIFPVVRRTARRCGRLLAGKAIAVLAAVAACIGCSSISTTGIEPVAYRPPPSGWAERSFLKTLIPSNDRDWTTDQAVLPTAEFRGRQVTVRNIRNIRYRTIDDFDVHYYDRTFNLDQVTSVDFIVVPFNDTPGIAHTMLSFGFEDRQYVGLSVEIRKERGEKYSPIKGFFRQYELMYVLADERDLILKNCLQWRANVYIYRTKAGPEQARKLFEDVLNRVNKLAAEPEFYDTLTNNCTTNIRNHINRCFPDRVPYDYRVLLPGYSAELAYDLGLLDTELSFVETQRRSRVNYAAWLYRDAPDFSVKIRQVVDPEALTPATAAGVATGGSVSPR